MTTASGAQLLPDCADALLGDCLGEDQINGTLAALSILREAAAAGALPDTAHLQLRIVEQHLQAAQDAVHRLAASLG